MFTLCFYLDYLYKATLSQIVVASSIGLIIAAAVRYGIKIRKLCKIIPQVWISDSSRIEKLEKFSHYVGNQQSSMIQTLASSYNTVLRFDFHVNFDDF